jgi:hypothetical protein
MLAKQIYIRVHGGKFIKLQKFEKLLPGLTREQELMLHLVRYISVIKDLNHLPNLWTILALARGRKTSHAKDYLYGLTALFPGGLRRDDEANMARQIINKYKKIDFGILNMDAPRASANGCCWLPVNMSVMPTPVMYGVNVDVTENGIVGMFVIIKLVEEVTNAHERYKEALLEMKVHRWTRWYLTTSGTLIGTNKECLNLYYLTVQSQIQVSSGCIVKINGKMAHWHASAASFGSVGNQVASLCIGGDVAKLLVSTLLVSSVQARNLTEAVIEGPQPMVKAIGLAPIASLIGSEHARDRWRNACASKKLCCLPPMASFSDISAAMKEMGVDDKQAPIAVHLNRSTEFRVADGVRLKLILNDVESKSKLKIKYDGHRKSVLYVAQLRETAKTNNAQSVLITIQALALLGIAAIVTPWASILGQVYIWWYVLSAYITSYAALKGGGDTAMTASTDKRGYLVTSDWNSDTYYLLIGSARMLEGLCNKKRVITPLHKNWRAAAAVVAAINMILSACMLGTIDWIAQLGVLCCLAITWIDLLPSKLMPTYVKKSAKLVFGRRRGVLATAYILHGKPQTNGWWKNCITISPRTDKWIEIISNAIENGYTDIIGDGEDDYPEVQHAIEAVRLLIKDGFDFIMPWAKLEDDKRLENYQTSIEM